MESSRPAPPAPTSAARPELNAPGPLLVQIPITRADPNFGGSEASFATTSPLNEMYVPATSRMWSSSPTSWSAPPSRRDPEAVDVACRAPDPPDERARRLPAECRVARRSVRAAGAHALECRVRLGKPYLPRRLRRLAGRDRSAQGVSARRRCCALRRSPEDLRCNPVVVAELVRRPEVHHTSAPGSARARPTTLLSYGTTRRPSSSM